MNVLKPLNLSADNRPGVLSGVMPALIVLALSTAGCGSLVETALEESAEEATGLEVVDKDGDRLTLAGSESSIVIGRDGDAIVVETESGSTRVTLKPEERIGQRGVPDGLAVPVPQGGSVETSNLFRESDGEWPGLTIRYPAEAADRVIDFYRDHFAPVDDVDRFEAETSQGLLYSYTRGEDLAVVVQTNAPGVLVSIRAPVRG